MYEGVVEGTLVLPRGEGKFGFDPVFLPIGSTKTLGEEKPDAHNARAKAVDSLMASSPCKVVAPIAEWNGKWQHD